MGWRERRGICSHSAATRALQLLPRFQMQLVWAANFLPLIQDPWCYANVRAQTTSSFVKFQECSVKCIVFVSKELGSVLWPSHFGTNLFSSLLISSSARSVLLGPWETQQSFSKKQHTMLNDRWHGIQTLYPGLISITCDVKLNQLVCNDNKAKMLKTPTKEQRNH